MGISTVSFNQAKIYKNKMFFAKYGKDNVCLRVFDNCGNNIINRLSYKPARQIVGDTLIIMRKKEYETFNNNICYEIIKRIYDKAGKLLDIRKDFCKYD